MQNTSNVAALLAFSLEAADASGSVSLRTTVLGTTVYFVAADACAALGIKNPTMALRALDDDEKALSSIEGVRGRQTANLVSESGFYALVLRCRDAAKAGSRAHRVRKWVTSTVLPSLRQHGAYVAHQERPAESFATRGELEAHLANVRTIGEAHIARIEAARRAEHDSDKACRSAALKALGSGKRRTPMRKQQAQREELRARREEGLRVNG